MVIFFFGCGYTDTCIIIIIAALHTAGKHMENSIVAAYVALLVGCLIQENKVS